MTKVFADEIFKWELEKDNKDVNQWNIATKMESSTDDTLVVGADPSQGAHWFSFYCVHCHGWGAKGDGPTAAMLNPRPSNLTNGKYANHISNLDLFAIIKGGGPARNLSESMPAWGNILRDQDIWNVIAFIRSLSKPLFDPKSKEGEITANNFKESKEFNKLNEQLELKFPESRIIRQSEYYSPVKGDWTKKIVGIEKDSSVNNKSTESSELEYKLEESKLTTLKNKKQSIKDLKELKYPIFPWPPPKASASHEIPNNLLKKEGENSTWGRVANRLKEALDYTGYTERSFFGVPSGFAIVTRLEQIYDDGRPKEEPERWSIESKAISSFSLIVYLKALLTAEKGFYRVIVFIITPRFFPQENKEISSDEASSWLSLGSNILPSSVADIIYTDDYVCTVLVYEFEQEDKKYNVKIPGNLTGKQHLENSGILYKLAVKKWK
ncbi:MAG: cytochrome c [Nitrospinae bacterium]|nr:cytochrome c [Nitrospinota bacterium]